MPRILEPNIPLDPRKAGNFLPNAADIAIVMSKSRPNAFNMSKHKGNKLEADRKHSHKVIR